MRSYEVRCAVTTRPEIGGAHEVAATVHLPDTVETPLIVLFGFPGGGYGRRYYDITAAPGYSQAAFHTDRGVAFVAVDHLAVGDSTQPSDPLELSYEDLAAANHAAAVDIVNRLSSGALAEGLAPIEIRSVVAMGQSMGGCLLTVQQANHGTFDGVAFLGWSGIHTNFPAPDGTRVILPTPARGTDLHPIAASLAEGSPTPEQFRYCFHWPDEEPALMEADLASYQPYTGAVRGDAASPWGSAGIPACAKTMMSPGAVAADAARIAAPVLVACGERDVVADPWSEPGAYRGSRDVSVFVVARMAHMHNFAQTRAMLWTHIHSFAHRVAEAYSASTPSTM
ncbi:MAG: alpha/beta hydrolase [Acidimicrobiia bacterium]